MAQYTHGNDLTYFHNNCVIDRMKTLGFYYTFLLFCCVGSWEPEPAVDCWEECFYEGDDQDQEAYKTLFQLGPETITTSISKTPILKSHFHFVEPRLFLKKSFDHISCIRNQIGTSRNLS